MAINGVLIFVFFFACCTGAMGQTVKEWQELDLHHDRSAADIVLHTYQSVQSEAVLHYRWRGNLQRAELVDSTDPTSEIFVRVRLAAQTQPEANLRDIVRKYIVDLTANPSPQAKPSDPRNGLAASSREKAKILAEDVPLNLEMLGSKQSLANNFSRVWDEVVSRMFSEYAAMAETPETKDARDRVLRGIADIWRSYDSKAVAEAIHAQASGGEPNLKVALNEYLGGELLRSMPK